VGCGSDADRFLYEKSRLWQAFSRPCVVAATVNFVCRVPMLKVTEHGSTSPSETNPLNATTPVYPGSSTCNTLTVIPCTNPHILPGVGSTFESSTGVIAVGKSSVESLRKGETQSSNSSFLVTESDITVASVKFTSKTFLPSLAFLSTSPSSPTMPARDEAPFRFSVSRYRRAFFFQCAQGTRWYHRRPIESQIFLGAAFFMRVFGAIATGS